MADNEVMDFDGTAERGSRRPAAVFDVGREPDPLYTLANERTYLAWLRLAVTLLAGAVAIDRLFLEHPRFDSQVIALILVVSAEMIGAQRGIGQFVLQAGNLMIPEDLLAGIVVLSLLGLTIGSALSAIERRLTRWR